MKTIYWIYALGFLAQGLFGARLIVQLVISEKQKKVASPTIFWVLSLAASFLFLIYGLLRNDIVIIFGQIISYLIYIRNLQLKNAWINLPMVLRMLIFVLPFLSLSYLYFIPGTFINIFSLAQLSNPIIITGMVGQLLLNFRFLYQWYVSEREQASVLPFTFWALSTFASILVIIYAYVQHDPVLLVAQGLGIFVYIRNMFLDNWKK